MASIQTIPIERRQRLLPHLFYQNYLSGAGKPVIVMDAMDGWKARSNWDLPFFKSRYGSDTVTVSAGLHRKAVRVMKLGDYIDYVESPSDRPAGFWIDPTSGVPLKDPLEPPAAPLYLYAWDPFREHPELLEDVELSPYFVDDWVPLLPPAMQQLLHWTSPSHFWVFIGPKGSLSRLHQDFWHTHAYLAQICGRKKCMLFSP